MTVTTLPRAAYRVNEISEMLGGVSRSTIYGWMKDGKIGSLVVGGRRFITHDHLETFLAAEDQKAARRWRSEDGIVDEVAAERAAFDSPCPPLTLREAKLAVVLILMYDPDSTVETVLDRIRRADGRALSASAAKRLVIEARSKLGYTDKRGSHNGGRH